MLLRVHVFSFSRNQPLHLVYTRGSLYIAMVQVLLPLMILSILAVVVKLPRELVRAARSLGANWWQTYWRIELPLIAPGIVTGAEALTGLDLTTFVGCYEGISFTID